MKTKISNESNIKAGIIISYITLILNVIVSIFYTPFLLKNIGESQYGLHSFVTALTSWLTVISSALVSSYIRFATRESAKFGEDSVARVNSIYFLIFSIISLLAIVLGAGFVLIMKFLILPNGVYANNQTSQNIIVLLSIISLVSIVISIPGNLFGLFNNWKQKFVATRLITLFVNVVQPIATVPFLIAGCDIMVVVLIQTVFTVAGILLNLFVAIKFYQFKFVKKVFLYDKQLFREIIVFSSFILLNSIVDQINTSADKTILGFMVKDNARSVAIYQAGMLFKNYLQILSVSISTVFSTKVNDAVNKNDIKRVNSIFITVSKFQTILILFIVGGFIAFGKTFTVLWLGKEFEMSFYVALVLFVISSVPYTQNVAIEVQRAMNMHKFRAFLYFGIALFNIGLTILLVFLMPNKPIWACLIGTAFTSILGHWIIINIYNIKVIKLNILNYFLNFIKIAFFAAIAVLVSDLIIKMAGITNLVISLFATSLIYISIYLIFILIFEKKYLVKIFKKGAIENL